MISKFKSLIKKTKTCWLWLGYTSKSGYGRFSIKGNQFYAHRIAYEIFIDKIPTGFQVCHKCDIPNCVNPEHLFLGTQRDNMEDMKTKGRSTKGRKPWCFGKHHSEETRRKMSENNIGMLGKHHSEETKKKMSKSRKGSKNAFYGRKHSEKTKLKISISQKNRLMK